MFIIRTCVANNFFFFFFNDTATTEIYTLSLHDALPISAKLEFCRELGADHVINYKTEDILDRVKKRSEEHTSELQSRQYLVCRLLLEKKKKEKENPVLYDATIDTRKA